jgi:hypothetical protein
MTRKRLKQSLSLFGSAVILATFIVKDARKEELKEFTDSLQSAENTFNIESAEQATYSNVESLERTINRLAGGSPTKRFRQLMKDHVWDADEFGLLVHEYEDSGKLLNALERLHRALPKESQAEINIDAIAARHDDVGMRLHALTQQVGVFARTKDLRKIDALADQANDRIAGDMSRTQCGRFNTRRYIM